MRSVSFGVIVTNWYVFNLPVSGAGLLLLGIGAIDVFRIS
jgi:hypothetical protein